jgi:hypothetical protein
MREILQDRRLFQSRGFIRVGIPVLTHQVQKSLLVLWAREGEPQFIRRDIFVRIADLSNHSRVRNQAEGEELSDVLEIRTEVLVSWQHDDLYEPVLLVKPIWFKIIVAVQHPSSVTWDGTAHNGTTAFDVCVNWFRNRTHKPCGAAAATAVGLRKQRKRRLFHISELDDWLRAEECSEISRRRKGREDELARRNGYQFGNLELRKRIKGPAVWIFRYWDRLQPAVRRRAITLGTVADYASRTEARRAAEGLRLQVNNGLPLREAVTFQGLVDRYIREEIEHGELAHTTRETELNRIKKHISPRWGRCLLKEVKPYAVQDWLRKLPVAPKTKSHLRGLMHRLFEKAMLWELIPFERNPISLVELKGVKTAQTTPDSD